MNPRFISARTSEGTCNDLGCPAMGAAGQRFGRNVPLEFTFPDKDPALLTPSPRVISRRLLARKEFVPASTLNLLAAAWIQFQVHDWFAHAKSEAGDHLKIPLEPDDNWPDNPMLVKRTAADVTRTPEEADRPPTYQNQESHWWGFFGENIYKLFGRLSDSEVISGIPGSPTDHDGVPYALTEEFVAVYRLHSLLPDSIRFYSAGDGGFRKELQFADVAFAKAREVLDDGTTMDDVFYSFGIAEPFPQGFGFGDTAFRVFILMASRRLKSDRFFTTDYRREIYTQFGLDWINRNGLSSVLIRHYPELKPALRDIRNAFAPWNRFDR